MWTSRAAFKRRLEGQSLAKSDPSDPELLEQLQLQIIHIVVGCFNSNFRGGNGRKVRKILTRIFLS